MTHQDLPAPTGRENNFDALRLSMALLVIFSHAYPLATGRQLAGGEMVSLGALAVAVFFIASGYLIAMSWARSKSLRDFLHRRAARIVPGFLVAFILSAWVIGPMASERPMSWFSESTVETNLVRLALLHHVEGDAFMDNPYPVKVNGSLWTIRFEFGCYLLVALAGVMGLMSRRWLVLGTFAASWAILLAWANGWVNPDLGYYGNFILGYPGNWLQFGTPFLAGATAYAFRDHIRYNGKVALVAAAAVVATFVLQDFLVHLCIWPIAVTYLVFWFAFTPAIRLHHTVARLGGDYSYGLYLYAFPVQQICVKWLGCHGEPLTLFVIATAITLVLGVLSWRLIERPFVSRRVPRRAATAVASSRQLADSRAYQAPLPLGA